jgi:hypothetical protein
MDISAVRGFVPTPISKLNPGAQKWETNLRNEMGG